MKLSVTKAQKQTKQGKETKDHIEVKVISTDWTDGNSGDLGKVK